MKYHHSRGHIALLTGGIISMAIAKRIVVFLLTNVLIIVTLSIIMSLLGIGHYRTAGGLDMTSLLVFCSVFGMGGAFISLFLSKMMAKWMYGVKVIPENESGPAGELVQRVHTIARGAGLNKMPEVGIYESPEVNAFATGPSRNNSLVAVSSGLLNNMDRDSVEGVLAHEVAHIANGDMVTMTLLQGIVNTFVMVIARIVAFAIDQFLRNDEGEGGLGWIAHMFVVIALEMLLMPLGMLVISAFSRHREYRADAGGAQYVGRDKMVKALKSLERHVEAVTAGDDQAVATMKISSKPSKLMAMFSTHPPLASRIRALETGVR